MGVQGQAQGLPLHFGQFPKKLTQQDALALVFAEDAADHDVEAGANVLAMGPINGDVEGVLG